MIVSWLGADTARAGSVWTEEWSAASRQTSPLPPTVNWNFHTYNIYGTGTTDSYSFSDSPSATLSMYGNSWGLESKLHFQAGAPLTVEAKVRVKATTPNTKSFAGITVYSGESNIYEEIALIDYSLDNSNLQAYRVNEGTLMPLNNGGDLTNLHLPHDDFYTLRLEYDGRGNWYYYLYDKLGRGGMLYSVTGRTLQKAPNIFILGTAVLDNVHSMYGNPAYQMQADFQKITVQANYNLFARSTWIDFLNHAISPTQFVKNPDNVYSNTETDNVGCPWYYPLDGMLYPQCDFIELAHNPANDTSAAYAASGSFETPAITRTNTALTWGEVFFHTTLYGGDASIQVLDSSGTPIADQYLPGNSSGFRSSPIRLSGLDTGLFPTVKLRANFVRGGDPYSSPRLNDLNLTFGTKSYFSWYDMQSPGMTDWLLMSNSAMYSSTSDFVTQLGAPGSGPSTYHSASPGSAAVQTFPGTMDGPLMVNSLSGLPQVISQRVLYGDSLEETPSIPDEKLSSHYYWPWYDMQSAGYKNWVVVSNPDNGNPVYYEIRMPGVDPAYTPGARGTIPPGGRATPTFPGVMGGLVEVQAWTDSGKTGGPAKVIASQRVLMNEATSFNEVNGVPAGDLKNHYLWTWYDQQSAGATNWVLVANPNASPVSYQISIAGGCSKGDSSRCQTGVLQPAGDVNGRDRVTPTFPGQMGGPVEVTAGDKVIASQRSLWAGSFEEVPGYPEDSLNANYHWTWYDNLSSQSRNWVVITNPTGENVTANVLVGGVVRGSFNLTPNGGMATPIFTGLMGGPVEVRAFRTGGNYSYPSDRRNVLASQRVLWSDHFNEVQGTVLDP